MARFDLNKVFPLAFCFIVIAASAIFSTGARASEEQKLAAAFEAYRSAALERRGEDAADQVTKGTIAYYQSSRDDALTLSRAALEQRSVIDQVLILSLRHYLSAAELRAMDGRGLFVWAVDEGLVGEEGLRKIRLTGYSIRGREGTGVVTINGQRTPFSFRFEREDGKWRLDLLSVMLLASKVMDMYADKYGDRKKFIEDMLSLSSGRQTRADIWLPSVR